MTQFSGQPGTNRPSWLVETTNPELVEPLKQAFSEIVDPEIGLNIYQLGLIRDVIAEENSVVIKMILTTPFCPYGPSMIETTREKAQEAVNLDTHIDLGMDMWDFSMMEEGLGAEWGIF